MQKQCCPKIKDAKNPNEICVDCVSNIAFLAENLGYDKDIWIKNAIGEISTEEDKFYCVTMKKLQNMVVMLSKRTCSLEAEMGDLLNDIKYALHDIQAPIRSIRSFSEFVLEKNPDCDKASLDYLKRINKASIRVTDMLNDIRDIMTLGKQKTETKRIINFSQIIKDVQDNLNSIITNRNAKIYLDVKNAPKFKSNILRWTRVFQNLISNSILYNISKTPTINIWFEEDKIYLKDNGIGIPPDKIESVFELFTRLSDRETMAEGTGAGLFMCRKFLGMDGFGICIESSSSEGTIFVITLPEKND